MIDMLYEGTRDFLRPLISYLFDLTLEEVKKKYNTEFFKKYLPVFEKVCQSQLSMLFPV